MSVHNKENSGLATTGMVLGIIAIVGSWIPFLNIVSMILAVLAIIFSLIPLFQKRSVGKAVAGLILGVVTLVIAFYMTNAAVDSIDEATGGSDSTSTSQNTEAEKTEFTVGEAISFDGKTVTVSGVERNWNSGNEFIVPDTGKEFVRVQIDIKNDSENRVSYNTFDWKIKDSNGAITDVDMNSFGDGALGSGELVAGGTVSGSLVFQAPAGDEGLVIHYEPSFWTNRGVEIKL